MKAGELREKSDIELLERLDELRKELFQVRFRSGQDEVEQRGRAKKMRREVARILTLRRERAMGIRGSAPGASREES